MKINRPVVNFFLLLLSFSLFLTPSSAQDLPEGPYFLVDSTGQNLEKFPLLSTDVDVQITEPMAHVRVTQIYQNTGEVNIEATYVFPASTGAALHGMTMKVNDRLIEAKIREKEEARTEYEEGVEAGKTSALLEQFRPNVFQMSVGNISPGARVEIELEYSEFLEARDGTYEFVYPTVVAPRYSSGAGEESGADFNFKSTEEAGANFSMNVLLESSFPIKQLRSTSHEVEIMTQGEVADVELKDSETKGGNRDFVLQFKTTPVTAETGIMIGSHEGEHYFILNLAAPEIQEPESVLPREYIFLLDVSGSMEGFPLELSKQVMKELVDDLLPTDRFNILTFAGGSETLWPSSQFATPDMIANAVNFLGNLNGEGGTELLNAIKTSFELPTFEGYSRSFVILTDGEITVERDCIDFIDRNVHEATFFALGIGSSVNRYAIEGIADAGHGFSQVVEDSTVARDKVDAFVASAASPLLTDIELIYDGMDVENIEPGQLPDLFSNRSICVTGKFKGYPVGKIKVKALSAQGTVEFDTEITPNMIELKGDAVRYYWARKRLERISDMQSNEGLENNKAQIVALGEKHNLLTDYTSFVAVDSEAAEGEEPAVKVSQPIPIPAGTTHLLQGVALASKSMVSYDLQTVDAAAFYSMPPVQSNNSVTYSTPLIDKATDFEEVYVEEEYFAIPDKEAEYPGGSEALRNDLASIIHYPKSAIDAGVEGTVYVRFTVNKNGKVKDAEVVRGINPELDAEAVRAVTQLKDFTPGSVNGRKIKTEFVVPVKFKMN